MATRRDDEAPVIRMQALFRTVNDEIETMLASLGTEDVPEFLCECGRDRCSSRIRMTIDEYEGVRTSPTRFVVVPGHEVDGIDLVVEENGRFAVVEVAKPKRLGPYQRTPRKRAAAPWRALTTCPAA